MSWQTITKENNLAISSIRVSELEQANILGAELYNPVRLLNINTLLSKKAKRLSDYFSVQKKSFNPKNSEMVVHLLELENIKNFDIVNIFSVNTKEISSTKNIVKKGDVLISRLRPYLHQICVSPQDNLLTTTEIIPLRSFAGMDGTFLYFFLCSKNIQEILFWSQGGNTHPRFPLYVLENLPLPLPSKSFQEIIKSIFIQSRKLKEKSEKSYKEAQQQLLKEINLEQYKPNEENISVRNLKDCLIDNRFDAEYWQPDFDVIIDKIMQYRKGVSTIGNEFKQLKGNFKAEKGIEYNYIEIGDVNVSTGEVGHTSIIGAELPANAKIKLSKKQLITSKVRPNRGATAILDDHEGYIGSGAFTVLVEKENINLETLMVYLKAKPIRELLLRYNTGTSYPVITDSDVLKLLIPLIDKQLQKKISELMGVSAEERQKAKTLLEKAKRAVEVFIEEDETTALKYLNRK